MEETTLVLDVLRILVIIKPFINFLLSGTVECSMSAYGVICS